jgi:hypothetical protein
MSELPVQSSQIPSHEAGEAPGEPQGRYGRRALMLGAAGGVGMAAGLLADSETASATEGSAVVAGASNTATSTTTVTTSSGNGLEGITSQNNQDGVYGLDQSTGGGNGVSGQSTAGTGVYGTSTGSWGVLGSTHGNGAAAVRGVDESTGGGNGVLGSSDNGTGVYGTISGGNTNGEGGVFGYDSTTAGSFGVQGVSVNGCGVAGSTSGDTVDQAGVFGLDGTGAGYGVWGTTTGGSGVYGAVTGDTIGGKGVQGVDSSNEGFAVFGQSTSGYGLYGSTTSGVGVFATSGSGTALQVEGIASFSRSGLAEVKGTASKSKSSIVVTGVALSASSMILATPQGHVAGVAVAGVVPDVSAGSFTIYLTEAVKVSLEIAWFIVDLAQEAAPLHEAPSHDATPAFPAAHPRVARPLRP